MAARGREAAKAWAWPLTLSALSALGVLLATAAGAALTPSLLAFAALAASLVLRPLSLPAHPALGSRGQERAWSLGLLAWALLVCVLGLGSSPPGPGFVESTMAVVCQGLQQGPYTPHVSEGQAAFPSLLFYQGLAATKLLGWTLSALRLPAALWAALSVPVFYLLLRQWSAPLTAGVFSLLLSVNNLFLCEARLFFPGSLGWFGLLAAALFLLQGLRRGGLWRFALAGLCAGLCFHAYVPGRAVLPLLLLWLGSGWLPGAQGPRVHWAQALVFSATALLVAAPVLLWARQHPDLYWLMPRRLGSLGPWDSLKQYAAALPQYARFLYSRADGITEPTDGLPLFPLLRPDPLVAIALPLGLGLCALAWRRAEARLILLGLFIGVAPAALAHDATHPNSRRALLALPWLYAAGAWAWDSLRASAGAHAQVWLRRLLLAGAAMGIVLSLQQYFVRIMGSPALREDFFHTARLVDAERALHPGLRVRASQDLVLPRSHKLVFFPDEGRRRQSNYLNFTVLDPALGPLPEAVKPAEDLLVPGGTAPVLLFAPYLRGAEPLLQRLFPGIQTQLYAEPRPPAPDGPRWDKVEPSVQLLSAAPSPAAWAAYRGLVDLKQAPYQAGARVDVWDSGFGAARKGQALDLGGAWISDGGQAEWSCAWPGWRLSVDGEARRPGHAFTLAPGAHRLRLRGSVGASGPLPLRLILDGAESDTTASVAPIDPRFGFDADWLHQGVLALRRWELLPAHRFYRPEGTEAPVTLRWSGRLQVPADGVYTLRLAESFNGRLRVGDQQAPAGSDEGLGLSLKAGVPVDLEVEGDLGGDRWIQETAYLTVKNEGDLAWKPVPFDWILAPAAFTRP
jgi:hypothetical protein